MLQAVIIDDDELSRKAIKQCIERNGNIELMMEFNSAVDAISEINKLECDLIFLDVEMPEMDGLEFISMANNLPQIVIISSKSKYAAEAYNYDVTDYLVKPINYPRFIKSIEKVKTIQEGVTLNNPGKDHLFFKKNNAHIRVDFSEIQFIEAYADYVTVYAKDQKFVVLSTMKAVEQRFPKNEFMRIHRSYIIRLDKIKSIEENSVCFGEKTIPVSRSYKAAFMDKMNIF